jgi:hypothetical protein
MTVEVRVCSVLLSNLLTDFDALVQRRNFKLCCVSFQVYDEFVTVMNVNPSMLYSVNMYTIGC